ncbi:hypothetical protein LPJGGPFB_05100 [Ensifer adhaerens]|uniref:hypothetical protein n=1 Tax=Ensifer adhaerens TaxID=106592 RepID=UPI001568B0AF|nr:hypothetical protein [Ensifer adhaerens]NRP21841.1 hypothetical protein [Ensifer adhaerens]
METVGTLFINPDRLADCRDMVEDELRELIANALKSAYAPHEVLVAISELTAEELGPTIGLTSIH